MIPAAAREIATVAGWTTYALSEPKGPGKFYALSARGDVILRPTYQDLVGELRKIAAGKPVVSMDQASPCPDCTWKTRHGCPTCLGIGMVVAQ